ncbi:uncharacterized protein METZ01_LOCUS72267, partial [marine metagenome]
NNKKFPATPHSKTSGLISNISNSAGKIL